MVASNTNFMETTSPQTQCSHCSTVFEVPQDLLESSDTRVKCGECFNIFDALDGLQIKTTEVPMTETLASLSAGATNIENERVDRSNYSDLDVTYSDFDLFSEDADTPYLDYFEETTDPVNLDFDAVEEDTDQTFSDTLFRNDVTVASDLPIGNSESAGLSEQAVSSAPTLGVQPRIEMNIEGGQAGAIEFDYDADKRIAPRDPVVDQGDEHLSTDEAVNLKLSPTASTPVSTVREVDSDVDLLQSFDAPISTATRSRGWIAPLLMVTALAVLLSALYLYRERASLRNNPMTRPIYVATCAILGCQVPAMSDLDQLRVLRRYVFSHPTIQDALVVNVVFRNEAEFEQRYPILVIKMSDITGKIVATRNFQPSEYLPEQSQSEKQTLAAQTSIEVSLGIEDPGKNANSFTIEFR